MVILRTLILLHGYGVRSFFWDPIKTFFESKFPQIYVPDLNMENPAILVQSTKEYVRQIKQMHPEDEIYMVGHSLGSAVALLLAQDLGLDVIKKAVMIAIPYGEQRVPLKSLTRFLIKYRLIPDILSRRRFFSKQTPKQVQKRMFKQVVPESDTMIDEILKDKFFHTDLIKGKLPQDCLILCSEYDKVVPYKQSKILAELIGAQLELYPKDKHVAHDDFITAPTLANEVSEKIVSFFRGDNWT